MDEMDISFPPLHQIFLSNLLIETAALGGDERPQSFSLEGVVAFCDISGFTKLTSDFTKRGPSGVEDLNKLLNLHYEQLISTISKHGGDVIAIIGDAALILFSSSKKYSHFPTSTQHSENPEILANDCARAVNACVDALGSNEAGLELHIGVSCGWMHALHVGGWKGKSQFLLVGEPLHHLQSTVGSAKSGTICISPQVHSLLFPPTSPTTLSGNKTKMTGGWNCIPTSSGDWLISKQNEKSASSSGVLPFESFGPVPNWEDTSSAETSQSLLSKYVCKSAMSRFSGVQMSPTSSDVDWLAEWRRLTVVFVKLHGFEGEWSKGQVDKLHQCFMSIEKAAQTHDGSVLHAFNDDKGTVAILVFGLPLQAHENDPMRAVACSLSLAEDLKLSGNSADIGISTGEVFCGCLGGPTRKDFTVLGSWVNMAARLMSSVPQDSPIPILCDHITKQASETSFSFSPQKPITLKGFLHPVETFIPKTGKQDEGGARRGSNVVMVGDGFVGIGGVVVGRVKEIDVLRVEMERFSEGFCPVVWISGDPGMGKSTLTLSALHSFGLPSRPNSPTQMHQKISFFPHENPFLTRSMPTPSVFYVKSEPFIFSDFQAWGSLVAQIVEHLMAMRGVGKTGNPIGMTGISKYAAQNTQEFLTELFDESFPHLSPFLSLLNPYLRTSFRESRQCSELLAKSRQEYLFELCFSIFSRALTYSPMCICIEDLHNFDSISWIFASRLLKLISEKNSENSNFPHATEIFKQDDAPLIRTASANFGRRQSVSLDFAISFKNEKERNLSVEVPHTDDEEQQRQHPLFMIFNSRKQKQDLRDEEGFHKFMELGEQAGLTKIELEPLGVSDVSNVITKLVPGEVTEVDSQVSTLVHERSQGNALFVRELVLSLSQQQHLSVDGNGRCSFSVHFSNSLRNSRSSSSGTDVPQSVQDVIRSRVDSLSADQQLLIKVASVIGLDFDLDVLVDVHPSRSTVEQMEDHLNDIERIGLCVNLGDGFLTFNHQLTQEVSYSLLTHSQKIELHRKVASRLEKSLNGHPHSSPPSPTESQMTNIQNPTSIFNTDFTFGDKSPSWDESLGGSPEQSQASSGSKSRRVSQESVYGLPALAHHWVHGKSPDKARPYLSKLAEAAHDNYKNKEAIRWFTVLFEQEEQCDEKSHALELAKWHRFMGECYFSLGDHVSANKWLQQALCLVSFEPPSGALRTAGCLIKQAVTQYSRRRKPDAPPKPSPKFNMKEALERIQILRTLSLVKYFLHDTNACLFYMLLGANTSEDSNSTSEGPVFYSLLGHILGAVMSRRWAHKYFDLSYEFASNNFDKVQVFQAAVPFFVWSCDPRAEKEIEDGLLLTRDQRCWKEMIIVHVVAGEYSYHHCLVSQYERHVAAALQESTETEDIQNALYAYLQHGCYYLMTDDRISAAEFLKKAIATARNAAELNVLVDKQQECMIPLLVSHLVFRDQMWPTAFSPHFKDHELESLLTLCRSLYEKSTPRPKIKLDLTTSTKNLTQMGYLQKIVECGLANVPEQPLALGFFHPLHLGLELTLLHGVPCDPKIVKYTIKVFDALTRHFTLFRPMSLVWSAFELFKCKKFSKTFSLLREASNMAQIENLPLQGAFAQFFTGRFLSKLNSSISGKRNLGNLLLSHAKIKKWSECDEPFEIAARERIEKARDMANGAGHTFYASMFSKLSEVSGTSP